MSAAVRLPFTFDVDRLRADCERAVAGGWERHFVRQNYEGEWSGIPLRTNRTVVRLAIDPTKLDAFSDTEEMARCAYIPEVLQRFDCPIGAVRLLRLTPGSIIKTHTDDYLSIEHGHARIHVPIQTNPGVTFIAGGEPVTLMPGECWYIDVDKPHSVSNLGTTDRIHLVIDAVANDWLMKLVRP